MLDDYLPGAFGSVKDELRAEADRLSQSDGQAARALQSQMVSLSSGWLGGSARVKWDELIADMARQAESIR